MPRAMGDTPARPAPPLLDRYDVLLMILVTAVAMALRFAWFSGYGLGDDILVRHAVAHYLQTGIPPGANFTYRFTWWVPTVLLAGRYGVGEMPMVLPNIVFDVFLFPVGYALGKAFFGRVAGIMAALQAEYVVLGGGNASKLKDLPPGTRLGANANAFVGGFRLWDAERTPQEPSAVHVPRRSGSVRQKAK
jgi:hypothetical protein